MSSASREADRLVYPTRSTNRTETRRSSAAGVGTCADAASGVPHSAQNFCPAVYGVPQLGHRTASGVPHSTQKRALSALTVEQDGQVNNLPISHARRVR